VTDDDEGELRPPAPEAMRLVLDGSVRRVDGGRVLIGGSPMRLLRLTEAGSRLVDRLAVGGEVGAGAAARRLARRLLDRGMAHPRMVPTGRRSDEVTVVIPVFDRTAGLERTLGAVAAGEVRPAAVVIVDDGSPGDGPASVERVAEAAGARVVLRSVRGGPGAARNSGLELVDTPLVAFVDADVELAPDWLAPLLPHFDDPAVVAVAPRVVPTAAWDASDATPSPDSSQSSNSPDSSDPSDSSDSSVWSVWSVSSVSSGSSDSSGSAMSSGGAGATESVAVSPRDPLGAGVSSVSSDSANASAGGAPNAVRSSDPSSPMGAPLSDESVPNRRQRAAMVSGVGGRWSLAGALDRFERSRSPLDLGPEPARVAPRTRVAYVPTATLLARSDAVRAVGAFDERMAFGEDVDLIWRLVEAGHTVRYEPAATVTHPTRPELTSWMRQRFDYGSSAAPLAARHPEAMAPVSVSAWSAAAWTLAATGFPLTGAAVAAVAVVQLPGRLRNLDHPWKEGLRLAGGGTWSAWRPLATAVTRTWWPAAVAAAVVSRRARRALLAAAVVPALVDWFHGDRQVDPAAYVALHLLDDLAYGAGVWAGCARERTIVPLVPDLTSWPGRRPAVE